MASTDAVAELADKIQQLINGARRGSELDVPQRLEALARVAARVAGSAIDQGSADLRSAGAQALGALFAQTAENIWTAESQIWPDADAAQH